MQKILNIANNIKTFLQETFMETTDASKVSSEFVQLENENQVAPPKIKSPPISFDHILTNHIQFGKYQYIAAIMICKIFTELEGISK
jgi:hypothetical protein